jgi:8-oxo-dGTP pyrophosphatase MutT (NUDIX family)
MSEERDYLPDETQMSLEFSILFDSPWLQVRQCEGWYTYVHTHNAVVYVLPYRYSASGLELLARFEVCPAHSPYREQTSITGQHAPDADPRETARRELAEEAGYSVAIEQLQPLGKFDLVKFADILGHLFAVDVTGMAQHDAPGDGSRGEAGSYCQWIRYEEANRTTCPVFLAMMTLAGLNHDKERD